MSSQEDVLSVFEGWYNQLRSIRGGFPARGTIAGALVVLERLKEDYDLDIDAHTARGGSQIIGASGSAVKKILEMFGETRPFVAEGGRTNRGLRGDIDKMLDTIKPLYLENKNDPEQEETLTSASWQKLYDIFRTPLWSPRHGGTLRLRCRAGIINV